jgi:hypothetical protein
LISDRHRPSIKSGCLDAPTVSRSSDTATPRIEQLRRDVEAFIDSRVEQERAAYPGIPAGALRNMMVRGNCQCTAYLQLVAKETA